MVISIAVLLAGYFACHFLKPEKNTILGVLFVNYYDDVSRDSSFAQKFAEYAGMQDHKDEIVFDHNVFFDLSKEADYRNAYYQKAIAYLEAGTTDAVICQYENLMGLAGSGRLMDLQDERTKALYEKYSQRIITLEKDGKQIPVGIDVTDSPVWKEVTGYADSCYLGISAYTEHFEMLECFVDYLCQDS